MGGMSVDPINDDERWLAAEVAAGRVADFTGRPGSDGEPVDIRGELLRALALAATRPAGLGVRGARIIGTLDLRLCEILGPLLLQGCVFVNPLNITKSRLIDVDLSGSSLPGLRGSSANIEYDLILRALRISGTTLLTDTVVGSRIDLAGAICTNPDGEAISADGARINGSMFCGAGFRAEGEVRFLGATIGGQLILTGGSFSNPNGHAISADGAQINGDTFCGAGFHAEGEVRLLGATIGGEFALTGGTFTNPNGHAISADGARINGGVFCGPGFRAEGGVRLLGATIGGELSLTGGTFTNLNGQAINGDRVRIDGSMFCRDGFRAEGEVRLLGATIGGQLDLAGGTFTNRNGYAISTDGARINGDMFCRDGFRAEGEVRLLGTTIGGQVVLTGGTFTNRNGYAISADGARIDEGMFCGDGFRAEGEVRLLGTTIGSVLDLARGTFTNPNGYAINADNARIGMLRLSNIDSKSAGAISFVGVHAGYLADDSSGWRQFTAISLLDFTYDRITNTGWTTASRVRWLKQDHKYRAQPYEYLAQTLRSQGHEREARDIMVAKNRRRRQQLKPWHRTLEYLFDGLLAYGYRPLHRTLPALLLLYFVGALFVFPNARHHQSIIATRAAVHQSTISSKTAVGNVTTAPSTAGEQRPVTASAKCPPDYPCFSPWAFTADALIPLINTHQTDFWAVSGATRVGFWTTLYSWLASALGWVLTTAAALGFTGLIRRD
jgi:hypothetical protein